MREIAWTDSEIVDSVGKNTLLCALGGFIGAGGTVYDETGCIELISGGFGAGEGAGGENGCWLSFWIVLGLVGTLDIVDDDVGVLEGVCDKRAQF